jgi:hypothetical protein
VIRRPLIAAALAWSLASGTWPAPARAVIPSAAKISQAVASANRIAGRSEPVLLDVTLTIGDGPPAATGVLATHPTGLARLELRSHRGFVERHLLQGNAHSASRDGEMLEPPHDPPRHFLPPVFLLQATSGEALHAALASFGIAADEVVLGRIGDFDCYVFGGRLPRTLEREERRLPSMWVDLESYEVVRIDGSDGVRYRFGPTQDFDGIRVPRWIVIEADDEPPARLDILRAAPANAPAAAFGIDWLAAPRKP